MNSRNNEDGTTLPISENSRNVVKKMKEHDLLSIGKGEGDLQTKDIYLLAVALGLGSPAERMVNPQSWTRTAYFQMEDKSLLRAILLDTADSSKDISDFCDMKAAFDYSRQFTDAGFRRIDEFAAEAMYDKELMVRKMLDYVDSIFEETVNCDN